ncbi:MAG: decapping endonuclease targeting mRNA [Piccolia ochrophora]|nr:MAG: decapping endonuclease targeting mRNA [Piccolia ochrophora]
MIFKSSPSNDFLAPAPPSGDQEYRILPLEIAFFSYDDDHNFRMDDSSLRYYYPPRLGANLCHGFETFEQLDDARDDHLDSLLTTIMDHERKTDAKSDADFITWRGMMTKIMASPFENFNGFEMNATCFQGTIFLEENHEHKLEQRQDQHRQPSRPGAPSQDMMSFWGYKFETLSLIPSPWAETSRDYIEHREDEVVNNHAQYCSVVRTGIGKTKMIIGGEVDAVWDAKPTDPDAPINWVELKTAEQPTTDRDMLKFERKLLKFWVQSFLLGVPKIIVGFRSRDGILTGLEELETQALPNNVKKKGKGSWDGNLCINFAASFLEWLKQTVVGDGVWRIRRRDKSPMVEVFKLEDSGLGDILTPEFVEWRQRWASDDETQS